MPRPDNLAPPPARLYDVVDREEWEGALRRCLADQAGGARPSRADLAGVAIRQGRRTQRRRTVLGLASVVAATVIVTGVWVQGLPGLGPAPEFGAVSGVIGDAAPTTSQSDSPVRLAADEHLPAAIAADVIAAGTEGRSVLATADGATVELHGVREVAQAGRVGDGWLVTGGQPGAARLWWLTADQPPVSLLAGMDAIAIDGPRISWQRGSLLSAAVLIRPVSSPSADSAAAPAPAGAPVGFVNETVLLSRTGDDGVTYWDIWHPASGDYQPTWTDAVVRVYGSVPDGSAVGLVRERPGAGRLCLARLTVLPTLQATQQRCLPGELADALSAAYPAALSPTGRWLVTGTDSEPLVVDLPALFAGPAAESVTALTGVAAPAAAPSWLGPDRVLLAADDQLTQLRPELLAAGLAEATEAYPLAAGAPVVVTPG